MSEIDYQQLDIQNKHLLEANKDLGKEIQRLTLESTKWESKFYDEAKKVDKAIEYIEKSWNDKCTIPLEEVGYSTDDRWEIWKILKGSE